jgi:hypothetical protein
MKTNPYAVRLANLGLRSPEHEVFARDPAVRYEIAMIPIRVGAEATLKASGLRFRIVTIDEFNQRVEIQLLRNRERGWIRYAQLLWWCVGRALPGATGPPDSVVFLSLMYFYSGQ